MKIKHKLIIFLTLLNKNKSTIILLILGLIPIFFIIYSRVFRTRESVDIILEFNLWKIFVYSCLVFINLFHLLRLILLIIGIQRPEKKSKYKAVWHRFILAESMAAINIYITAKEMVNIYIIKKIPKRDIILNKCCNLFYEHEFLVPYGFIIIILLCQFIVLTTFIIDVFYFQRFHWFYKSLILLLVPILSKAFVSVLEEYAQEWIDDLNKYVHFTYNKERNSYSYTPRTEVFEKYAMDQEDYDEIIVNHCYLKSVRALILMIKYHIKDSLLAQIFQGFKHTTYIITWGYLVFLMISG